MRAVPATPRDVARFAGDDDDYPQTAIIGGDEEGTIPVPVLLAGGAARVGYKLDADEVARLAAGGTLWLSTWGTFPIHLLEVHEDGGNHAA